VSDDLDLDLDAFDPEKHPRQPRRSATAEPRADEPDEVKPPAQAVASHRPGLFARCSAALRAPWIMVREQKWNWKTFLWGLAGLILLVLFVENWIPMRFYFLGWRFEVPRTLAFVVDMGIGALLMWWWLRHNSRDAAKDDGESES
jgi:uncharacterized integral membrane protein